MIVTHHRTLASLVILSGCFGSVHAQPDREFLSVAENGSEAPRPREIFYLGRAERTFHKPLDFYQELRRPFAERGMKFSFFDQLTDLNTGTLGQYDCLFMFGDVQTSTASSELFGRPYVDAIVDYVEGGGGLTGMHVASACFRNSATFGNLLGGRFLGHLPYQGFTPVISTTVSHPIIESLGTYTSLDEPYQIKDLNPDVTLLGSREGIANEPGDWPYTWVRTQGTGRVFYHANGHNISSWNQPNFRELMIRGTEWSAKTGSSDSHGEILRATISKGGVVSYLSEVVPGAGIEYGVFTNGVRSTISGREVFDSAEFGVLDGGVETVFAKAGSGSIAIASPAVRSGQVGPLAAFLLGPEQCPHLVAGTGLPCPQAGPGITYSDTTFGDFKTSEAGFGLLRAAIDDPDFPDNDVVILKSDGINTGKVVMEGEVLPAGAAIISNCADGLMHLSETGIITLTCEAVENGMTQEYLLSDRSGTGLEVLLSSGEASPGLPNGVVLGEFAWVKTRASGEVLFKARLQGVGVDATNDLVVCSFSVGNALSVLLREGMQLEGAVVTEEAGSWEVAASDDHCVIVISLAMPTGGVRQEVFTVGDEGIHSLAAEGGFLQEEGVLWQIGEFETGSLACKEDRIVVGVGLDDGTSQENALLLLGRVLPRVLIRTGWDVPAIGGDLTVNELSFQGGDEASCGINHERLVVVVRDGAGRSQLTEIGIGNSLDGDLLDDDLEIIFGGDADSLGGIPPAGTLRIASPVASGETTLSFWRNELLQFSSYQIEQSADMVNWSLLLGTPALDPDQSGVKSGFKKYSLSTSVVTDRHFYRVVYQF
jgi:type 1 glutamine amidotransferase